MKKFVIPLLCILMFTGCTASEGDNQNPEDAQTAVADNTNTGSRFSYVNQLNEQKKDMETIKGIIAADITDPAVKAEVEAGIELGVIGENSVIDTSTDANVFESSSIKVNVPEGFTKTKDSNIVTGVEKLNDNGSSVRISFNQIDQNSPLKRYEGMTESEANYTADQVKERYIPKEPDEMPEGFELSIKANATAIVDTEDRVIIKNISTGDNNSVESLSYNIWDKSVASKIITVYVSVWGDNDPNIATAYDNWVQSITIK